MDITLSIPDAALPALNREVARTNEANGTNLTLGEWLELHLKEIAIAEPLNMAIRRIQEEQEQTHRDAVQAALRNERDRLLAELEPLHL